MELDVVFFDVINIFMCCECDGDYYVLNGEKWWLLGVGDLCCQIYIVMVYMLSVDCCKYEQYFMIFVFVEMFGIMKFWVMEVFGDDDVLYGYMYLKFENVCVLVFNLLFSEGCGFEIV